MKKLSSIIIIIIVSLLVFSLGFNYKKSEAPKTLYQVYLDDQVLGVVESKKELEQYIDDKGKAIKKKVEHYNEMVNYFDYIEINKEYLNKEFLEPVEQEIENKVVKYTKILKENSITTSLISEYRNYSEKNKIYTAIDSLYVPQGLEIKKIATYNGKVDKVEDVYTKIINLRTTTVKGYQVSIKYADDSVKTIYVLDEKIFKAAMQKAIETFVGKEKYEKYLKDEQEEIVTVGEYINNVYVDQPLTIKEVYIPTNEKIYTDVESLTNYLLFGTNEASKTYIVKLGDTIKTVASINKINVEEFFISNPEFNSITNILSPGRKVKIRELNPVIDVVIEKTTAEDVVNKFKTEYRNDSTTYIGNSFVIQKGSNGLDRVTSKSKIINGNTINVERNSIIELAPSITQIVSVGTKYQYTVGSLDSWGWPTVGGWSISSHYGWRTMWGAREFHSGLDIYAPHGTNVYAVNNGTILQAGWHYSYGNYIIINHNNGYYTLYAHMSSLVTNTIGQTVARGDTIGYIGRTGSATGPHLHIEVWQGGPPFSGNRLDPMLLWQ